MVEATSSHPTIKNMQIPVMFFWAILLTPSIARFPLSVFFSVFGADFVCAEEALLLKKNASHYEHRSCFRRRGVPRRLMSARTKLAIRSVICPLAVACKTRGNCHFSWRLAIFSV